MNSRSEGFTLAEIMIVVLLSSIIMGSIYQMIVMQDKTTREQYAVIETQQNARTALAVMTADLKEISAVDGDVLGATETSITFRALRKGAMVCAVGLNTIDVAELGGPFVVGDNILVFSEGANANSAADDSWLNRQVSAVAALTSASCPAGNAMGAVGWRRLLLSLPPTNVQVGALLRSYTPMRYSISDNGEWGQLMRRVSEPPIGATVESAIIDRLSPTADGGLQLRYFNAAGTQITAANLATNLNNIMRVQVKVRGKAVTSVATTGNNRYQDSLVTTVFLRGNYRSQ
jgi:prepilin-type N-terminal cleavage/methylation domain-containing protein